MYHNPTTTNTLPSIMVWYENPQHLSYCEQPSCNDEVKNQCREPEHEQGCFYLRMMVEMANMKDKIDTLDINMIDVKDKVHTLDTQMQRPRPSSSSPSTNPSSSSSPPSPDLPLFNPTQGFHDVTSSNLLQGLTNQEILARHEGSGEYCNHQTHGCAKAFAENGITSKTLFDTICQRVEGSRLERGDTYSFCSKPVAFIPNKEINNKCQMWDVTDTTYMEICHDRS